MLSLTMIYVIELNSVESCKIKLEPTKRYHLHTLVFSKYTASNGYHSIYFTF